MNFVQYLLGGGDIVIQKALNGYCVCLVLEDAEGKIELSRVLVHEGMPEIAKIESLFFEEESNNE